MEFLDFFAGIGGFRRGMEAAGHKCVGFCEFDNYAVMSYTSMHLATDEQRKYLLTLPIKQMQKEILKEDYRNGEWYANDIRRVDASSLPAADCWCFGFPCQDISICGKRIGFSGHRSSLFFAVTKLIGELQEENRPKYLFIENVKNLLSVNGGFDFARLLIELDEIGYDAEWDVINSKDHGVPQNRERVFVIGHFRGRCGRKVFPLPEADTVYNKTGEDGEVYKIAQCLTSSGNDKWNGDYIIKQIGNCMPTDTRDNPNQGRIYDPQGISPFINKMDGGGREPLIPISMTYKKCKQTDIAHTLMGGSPGSKMGNHTPITGVMYVDAEVEQNSYLFYLSLCAMAAITETVTPFPACLYNCLSELTMAARSKYSSGQAWSRKHSRGVNFRIRIPLHSASARSITPWLHDVVKVCAIFLPTRPRRVFEFGCSRLMLSPGPAIAYPFLVTSLTATRD